MTKKIEYVHGRVCPKHPEYFGQRYPSGGCVACQRSRRRNRRKEASLKAYAVQPIRDTITQQIAEETLAARRIAMAEVRREERRRQIRREEDDGQIRWP